MSIAIPGASGPVSRLPSPFPGLIISAASQYDPAIRTSPHPGGAIIQLLPMRTDWSSCSLRFCVAQAGSERESVDNNNNLPPVHRRGRRAQGQALALTDGVIRDLELDMLPHSEAYRDRRREALSQV
jgi:hypothetical protein